MSVGGLYKHDMCISTSSPTVEDPDLGTGYPIMAWVDDSDSSIRVREWNGTEFTNPLGAIDGAFGQLAQDIAIDSDGTKTYLAFHNPEGILGVMFIEDGLNTLATSAGEEPPLGPGTGALIDVLWHSQNGGIAVADYAIDGGRVFFYYSGSWTQLGSDGDIEALGGGLPEGSLAAFPPKLWNNGPNLNAMFSYWCEGVGMIYRTVLWVDAVDEVPAHWVLYTDDDTWCTNNGTDNAPAFCANHVSNDEGAIVTARVTSNGGDGSLIRMFWADGDGWNNDPSGFDLAAAATPDAPTPLVAEGSLSISQQERNGQMIVVFASTDGDVYAMASQGFYGENDGWTPLGRRADVTSNIAGATESLNAQYPIVIWEDPANLPLYAWILLLTSDGKLQARRILMEA